MLAWVDPPCIATKLPTRKISAAAAPLLIILLGVVTFQITFIQLSALANGCYFSQDSSSIGVFLSCTQDQLFIGALEALQLPPVCSLSDWSWVGSHSAESLQLEVGSLLLFSGVACLRNGSELIKRRSSIFSL